MNIGKKKWYFVSVIIISILLMNAFYFFFTRQWGVEAEPQTVVEAASLFVNIVLNKHYALILNAETKQLLFKEDVDSAVEQLSFVLANDSELAEKSMVRQ